MAWVIVDPRIGIQPIAETSTTASTVVGLGDIVQARDPDYGVGQFIYLKGVASTVVGSWVIYRMDDATTTLAVANDHGPVAVSMSANAASTSYGWYQIQGKASAKFLTAFVDNGVCYLTATAGSLDDTDVAGDFVSGALGASAVNETTLLADVELWGTPFVRDGLDN